jgi:taspase (threonine aspartase 1)
MNFEPKHGGAICLHVIPSGCVEFSWVHSTDDMIIGYASSSNGQQQQKVILSKLGCNDLISSSKTNNTAAGWISF